MRRHRVVRLAAAFVLSVLLLGSAAHAAGSSGWPEPGRTVTLVVPFNPGGGTDIIGRQLTQVMERQLGVPVPVLNLPGAGSGIGTNEVMLARPDGYTLLLSGTHTITAALQGYTAQGMEALTHIASLNWDPYVIAIHQAAPYQTLADLVAGGSGVTMGNAGAGALTHLVAEALKDATGAAWRIVPFEGGGPLVTAVLGQHVTAGIFSQSEVRGQAGQLRALAVTSSSRSPLFPDVPTLAELGIDGIPQGSFRSISAPAGLPASTRAAIAAAIERALDDPEFDRFAHESGLIREFREGEELERYFSDLTTTLRGLLIQVGAIEP